MPKSKQKTDGIIFGLIKAKTATVFSWFGLGWPKKKLLRSVLSGFLILCLLTIGSMYGLAQWYINKHKSEPISIGATFVPNYAKFFGLSPEKTFDAMTDDLGIKRLRLVSYWNSYEPSPGKYDFSQLDWQFKKAEQKNIKVTLAIGLRQPRWPECHMPEWAAGLPKDEWYPRLKDYIKEVVERYKSSPALVSYQLENEYFLKVFGNCPDHSKSRLIEEFNYVKSIDPNHPLIVTRSDNALPSWPVGQPRSDINGASVYKRVWDKTITKRYFEYPYPAWFYAFLAAGSEITTGRNTFIHELQTEAWLPDYNGFSLGFKKSYFKMNDIDSIPEQNKSLDADRLADRFDYGVGTGMRTMDVWGVEWWYWRKEKAGDPSLWETAKAKIREYDGTRSTP